MTAKNLVLNATTELLGNRDLSAIDRHWAAGYIEHTLRCVADRQYCGIAVLSLEVCHRAEAGRSAFSLVVTTTDTHAGATSPFAFATFPAISVSRWIADAGTGEPGTGPGGFSLIISPGHPLERQ